MESGGVHEEEKGDDQALVSGTKKHQLQGRSAAASREVDKLSIIGIFEAIHGSNLPRLAFSLTKYELKEMSK